MKFYLIFFIFIISSISFSEDFVRELPSEELLAKINPQNFPNMDAVIIIKEQSYQIQQNDVFYRGIELTGMSTLYQKIIIVKLFNESAVERYGDFEYTYNEHYGDTFPAVFNVKARVRKEDGDIIEMPENMVTRIISRESSSGDPLTRKIVFKLPDLAVGDVLQIEYNFLQNFTTSSSGIFYYNDKDFVLYSNLYITLPFQWNHQIHSFPEKIIGKPKSVQISKKLGAGETFFWSVKNLNPIPDEPFSSPFADRSMLTAFVTSQNHLTNQTWQNLVSNYYENYLDGDNVSDSELKEIGFDMEQIKSPFTFGTIDTLYTSIRESIKLVPNNSIYPLSDDIGSIFDKREGDASDLAYIFYNVLKSQEMDVAAVWIRDKREGIFEKTVPTQLWFDRMAVLVKIGGEERIYDFDRCIPQIYHTPWFLTSIQAVILHDGDFEIKVINKPQKPHRDLYKEVHLLTFNSDMQLQDSLEFRFSGMQAEKIRGDYYDVLEKDVKVNIERRALNYCFSTVDQIEYDNMFSEEVISLSMKGNSENQPDFIENIITFKIANHSIEDFYNQINKTMRLSNYNFGSPFKIEVTWSIEIPSGYKVDNKLSEKVFKKVDSISAYTTFKQLNNKLLIYAAIDFPNSYVSSEYHKQLIGLLSDVRNELEEDVILIPLN